MVFALYLMRIPLFCIKYAIKDEKEDFSEGKYRKK
jgi:hypothetical protein